MTIRENIKAILNCNFSIVGEEYIEIATNRIMEIIDNVPTVCGNNPKWCENCVSKGKCASTRPQGDNKEAQFVLNHLFYDCGNMTQKEYDILLEAIKEADNDE